MTNPDDVAVDRVALAILVAVARRFLDDHAGTNNFAALGRLSGNRVNIENAIMIGRQAVATQVGELNHPAG